MWHVGYIARNMGASCMVWDHVIYRLDRLEGEDVAAIINLQCSPGD